MGQTVERLPHARSEGRVVLRFCLAFAAFTVAVFIALYGVQDTVIVQLNRHVAWLAGAILSALGAPVASAGPVVSVGTSPWISRTTARHRGGLFAARRVGVSARYARRRSDADRRLRPYLANWCGCSVLIAIGVLARAWLTWPTCSVASPSSSPSSPLLVWLDSGFLRRLRAEWPRVLLRFTWAGRRLLAWTRSCAVTRGTRHGARAAAPAPRDTPGAYTRWREAAYSSTGRCGCGPGADARRGVHVWMESGALRLPALAALFWHNRLERRTRARALDWGLGLSPSPRSVMWCCRLLQQMPVRIRRRRRSICRPLGMRLQVIYLSTTFSEIMGRGFSSWSCTLPCSAFPRRHAARQGTGGTRGVHAGAVASSSVAAGAAADGPRSLGMGIGARAGRDRAARCGAKRPRCARMAAGSWARRQN